MLPLLFDDLLKYNINVSFTLKNKIKSQTAQIEFHKFSKKLASGVEVVWVFQRQKVPKNSQHFFLYVL